MWLITRDGFYSIVQHRDSPNTVIVRSRARLDLVYLQQSFPPEVAVPEIVEMADADYPFRVIISKPLFKMWLQDQADDVKYDNFKAAVADLDPTRAEIYSQVYGELIEIEHGKLRS